MIRDYHEAGKLEQLHENLMADTLDDRKRESLGLIHPTIMGGEYLPNYVRGEVEIARIELESTTSDVISLRARPFGSCIKYRWSTNTKPNTGCRSKLPYGLCPCGSSFECNLECAPFWKLFAISASFELSPQEQQRQAHDGQCGASAVNKSFERYLVGKFMDSFVDEMDRPGLSMFS